MASLPLGLWSHLRAPVRTQFARRAAPQCFQAPLLRRRALHRVHASTGSPDASERRRLVFLGTPEVAASALRRLWSHCEDPNAGMEVVAVVTQPPTSRGRGQKKAQLSPSPVAQAALDLGLPHDLVLTPATAREELFLEKLQALQPHLCITAAYGNFLPSRFLSIPLKGTVNIHPSLLPQYRGASPVQRALEDGVHESGVTVAFTVLAMDAGPIIAQERVPVDGTVKAPKLLESLFELGTSLLIQRLPTILSEDATLHTTPQDDSRATHAPKVRAEEGLLDFSQPAAQLHNKVRAFAGWPGTRARLLLLRPGKRTVPETAESGKGGADREGSGGGEQDKGALTTSLEQIELKILTTRAGPSSEDVGSESGPRHGDGAPQVHRGKQLIPVSLSRAGEALLIPCDDGSTLEVLELQPPSKKAMQPKSFWNGLQGRPLFRLQNEAADQARPPVLEVSDVRTKS